MIVYKVVRNKDGKLKSAMPRPSSPRVRVRVEYAQLAYAQGRVTKPKFGKIFAFSNLGNARHFSRHMSSYLNPREIWEAETPKAEPIKVIASDSSWGIALFNLFKDFWARGEVPHEWMTAPSGTVVCPALKLIRKVG